MAGTSPAMTKEWWRVLALGNIKPAAGIEMKL
jgi:hypothetical protein